MTGIRRQGVAAAALTISGCLFALTDPQRTQGQEPRVHATYNLGDPDGSPFPNNWFAVRDSSQKTGLRINFPKPDCSNRPSDCEDIDVINTLDGFNLQPRLSIPFDG